MVFLIDNVINVYDTFDLAHNIDHVEDVIKFTVELFNHEDKLVNSIDNKKLGIIIACYHDIGIQISRDNHELHGVKIFREHYKKYPILKINIKPSEKELIEEAILQHRSSYKGIKTPLGKIASDADSYSSFKTKFSLMKRSIQFNMNTGLDRKEIQDNTYNHFKEKYSKDGYKVFYFEYTKLLFNPKLEFIRELIENKDEFTKVFNYSYNEIIGGLKDD